MCIGDENFDTGPVAGKKLQKGTRKEKKERTEREKEKRDRHMMTLEMFDFVTKEVTATMPLILFTSNVFNALPTYIIFYILVAYLSFTFLP